MGETAVVRKTVEAINQVDTKIKELKEFIEKAIESKDPKYNEAILDQFARMLKAATDTFDVSLKALDQRHKLVGAYAPLKINGSPADGAEDDRTPEQIIEDYEKLLPIIKEYRRIHGKK